MAWQVDPEEMDTHDEEFLGLQPEPMDCHGQKICISEHQHMNPAGGFVFTTTQETQLQRFLCLGASCNGYQTGRRRELKLDDARFILQLVGDGYGKKVVDFLTDFSTNCRSFKQDPTSFTLALCCRSSDEVTKHAAFAAVQKVCRTPTHLFRYLDYCQKISLDLTSRKGWGRGLRKAVYDWYRGYGSSERNLKLLALHLTKYTKRYG
ncbi:RNA-binding protein RO60-like isoform X2 [Saccostrea echinata]|uniref:RNA-binding protein RO60-like isoform X2 n=1 Tax=Saccostrea echinata TaxID=191078 RepID=UPI002A818468|nr:RNA-binding protein RO60-like isoform X2 [Saccostrea echinata]